MRRHLTLVALSLLLIWLLLTDADNTAWLIGAVTVAAAVWLTARIQPQQWGTLSLTQLVRFVPYFLWESLLGGMDVARRVLIGRELTVSGQTQYRMTLQRPDAQLFFLYCINLLPGTLTLSWQQDTIRVHLLDGSRCPQQELRTLETRVAQLFPHPRSTGASQ